MYSHNGKILAISWSINTMLIDIPQTTSLMSLKLPDFKPEEVEAWLTAYLQKDWMVHSIKLKQADDRIRSKIGRLLLRINLAELGLNQETINIGISCYGKPVLSDYPHIHFNISHAGNWVVCAVSSYEVGVDVERVKDVDISIARRYFDNDEYMQLMSVDAECRSDYFFRLWTIKESYLKALGYGLQRELSSFSITIRNSDSILVRDSVHQRNKFQIHEFSLDSIHKLALCVAGNNASCKHRNIAFDEFMDKLKNIASPIWTKNNLQYG